MIPFAENADSPSWTQGLWGTSLSILIIVAVASVLHLITARVISRAVKRWIESGRSRENSLVERPEETVELQAMIMSQRR